MGIQSLDTAYNTVETASPLAYITCTVDVHSSSQHCVAVKSYCTVYGVRCTGCTYMRLGFDVTYNSASEASRDTLLRCCFVRSLVPSFLGSFVPSFVRSLVRSFLGSFLPFLPLVGRRERTNERTSERCGVPSFRSFRSFLPFLPSFRSFLPSPPCFILHSTTRQLANSP